MLLKTLKNSSYSRLQVKSGEFSGKKLRITIYQRHSQPGNQHILCHWSLSIPSENKTSDVSVFQGYEKSSMRWNGSSNQHSVRQDLLLKNLHL